MSDYMFMLENHLNGEQTRFLNALEEVCDATATKVFLAGGAMRDMLGGFPIKDLDFVVESNGLKIARELAPKLNASITATDESRKSAELVLPAGATVSVSMAQEVRYLKPGGKPHLTPATIHEDLRSRDFTINSIALSVGKASKGLLLDPANGLADLERRELRAIHNYVLYDDPVRLWRLMRLKVRLGFTLEERTAAQYANARQTEVHHLIAPRALFEQLRQTANEPNPADVVKTLEEENLLAQVSPALTGSKLNLQGFSKLLKTRQLVPFGVEMHVDNFALLLYLLSEKLSPKERSALWKAIAAEKPEIAVVDRLAARAKKLESAVKSAKLQKPSQIYAAISTESGEVPIFLYMTTSQRIVQDRVRNYLQRYLPSASEISDKEIEAEGLLPGSPKFLKRKAERIKSRLDARPKKVVPVEEPAPPPIVATAAGVRRP